jgi:hypothetical protein
MKFDYEITGSETGNYVIRKKGNEAGKKIERKGKETTDTHFFLNIPDNTDNLWNLKKVNDILQTITYEYVYEGTTEKASRKDLTKKDIENILNDIENYKGKTIIIKKPKLYCPR